MSPISTAQLNPNGHAYCLAPPLNSVLVPILVNNTVPTNVRFSLTPLGYVEGVSGTGRVEYIELSAKDLKAIEQARVDNLRVTRSSSSSNRDVNEYDEYDDDDDDEDDDLDSAHSQLQQSQSLAHMRLTKPGTIRLERISDGSNVAVRLVHPVEVTIVPCPSAQFVKDSQIQDKDSVRCAGNNPDYEMAIDIKGVPPLSLRWSKEVNGKKEHFLVEGVEGSHEQVHSSSHELGRRRTRLSQSLRVPLTAPLESLGKHTYTLEGVIDGMGNVVNLGSTVAVDSQSHDTSITNSKITRSLTVLRRPSVSFKHCGPGHPTPLLIGSEAPLTIALNAVDQLDAPWGVTVKYQPIDDGSKASGKRYKPWTKTIKAQEDYKDLTLRANAPGEYSITGVEGKGEVMAPETCRVVEKPIPTAEIEWRKIHECSGDTGVSASLVLHGTPPFQVYYRTVRDNEQPRELVKTFSSSRGELTLQPERSGHYLYTFVQLSDANYRKVDLNGPSIDQIVHPLAAADFSHASSSGRSKRMVNSCSGNLVDIEVDLRGTAPWNLEVQIVGSRSTETLSIPDIATSPAKLQIPIPSAIDKEGGTFDVDLVSVEDAYGCKRSITVPGVSVNVRRVKPTAKFYGKVDQRQVTVREDERAELPLRLTGDGPWRVKYRRTENPEHVQSVTLNSPNDYIRVTEKGTYELIDVLDSQCPGSVITGEESFIVHWVPKPSAKLLPQTTSTFDSFNRSHILPSLCQGQDDHVDLELNGTYNFMSRRPPFQIMYNIARNDNTGGTIVLDQPTFSSIQPRTRFQLHTSKPGRMYYEVKQIGDAAYPLAKYKNAVIPRSERLVFEQEVLGRPSAHFRSNNRMSYCLNDAFVPQDAFSLDNAIHLEGTPPFQLQLSIKNLATNKVHREKIEIYESLWRVDLSSYRFMSIGPHLVTIESIQDASRCEQATLDALHRSIWVDVAETAAIIPFDKREDICVGEVTQFQLEGTPPWTVGYRINTKSYSQEAKLSPFSLLHQQAGEFTITSVAHQQKMCKAAVTDLRFTVHSLPSAQVGNGKGIIQDIHEGDQAEIAFTLIGEPPFTFTYQRSEPSPKKGGKPSRVLETHTVSGVTTNEYSIFSALEGTWTVTSISDRYCRYPAQPEGMTERSKH
ncbi:hypothetical protein SERLA73DRAFT_116213 [Serpula lacrymans var. lacrymans S7.3]|uniref:Nucleoporin Pom152 n=1 Tax=Serpula lacrymans var. lacrymans (strain S7.3) TaxID=936435 RepID=F8QEU9_SERL3|nr:hypothetical protein SERLA73DRAFT_116213 [Serpula lacrymans var. lacrymans S7.3]